MSFVRGYKEHQCRFIFRFKELHLGRLARAFGLLRLPRMPETKRGDSSGIFSASAVSPDDVPYKDRAREKQRQARRAQDEADAAAARAQAAMQAQAAQPKRPAAEPEAAPKPTAQKRRLVRKACFAEACFIALADSSNARVSCHVNRSSSARTMMTWTRSGSC